MQQIKKFKITNETPQRTAGTSWYEVELTINDKNVFVSMWFSYDRDLGETDRGYEILEDSDDLTEEEKEAVKEYIDEEKIKFVGNL